MSRGTTAPPRPRRGALELHVDDGEVQLRHADGRVLLQQGAVAIDVTKILVEENYPAGRVALRLRRTPDAGATVVVNRIEAAADPVEIENATVSAETTGGD